MIANKKVTLSTTATVYDEHTEKLIGNSMPFVCTMEENSSSLSGIRIDKRVNIVINGMKVIIDLSELKNIVHCLEEIF